MIELPAGTQGLVFDCDGTLIDSMPLHKRLWVDCLEPHGVVIPDDFIDLHAGKPTDVIVEIINLEFAAQLAGGVAIDHAVFHEAKESRFRSRIAEAGPIEPVVATAQAHFGSLPMAVVSGGCRENVELSLVQIGVAEWFPVVLTADDPITPKPAPDLFLAAADRLGVAPERCHAFEDADAGIDAARAAGMTVTDVREVLAA